MSDVPTPPREVTATNQNASSLVYWLAPESSGGSSITQYKVVAIPDNAAYAIQVVYTISRSTYVFSLINFVPYTIQVYAINSFGESLSSSTVTIKPFEKKKPGPPINIRAIGKFKGVVVEWDPPINDGGSPILKYRIVNIQTHQVLETSEKKVIFENLENGVTYRFFAYAINALGTSVVSKECVLAVPGIIAPPINVAITLGDKSATLTWTKPSADQTYPFTHFLLNLYPNYNNNHSHYNSVLVPLVDTQDDYSYKFTDLYPDNIYIASIKSWTEYDSSTVENVQFAAVSVPYPPTQFFKELKTFQKTTRVTLTWQPAVTFVNYPVLKYHIISYPAMIDTEVPGHVTGIVISDLDASIRYQFYISAINSLGGSGYVVADDIELTNNYKKLKTGGNDPRISKKMRYSQYLQSSLYYQAVNMDGGAAFIS